MRRLSIEILEELFAKRGNELYILSGWCPEIGEVIYMFDFFHCAALYYSIQLKSWNASKASVFWN